MRDINLLYNPLIAMCNEFVKRCKEEAGIPVVIHQTLRTKAEQLAIWNVGRDASGKVIGKTVTTCPPGFSPHEYGLAFDFAPQDIFDRDKDGNKLEIIWSTSQDPSWKKCADIAQSMGCFEVGYFWNIPGFGNDAPHIQLKGIQPFLNAFYNKRITFYQLLQKAGFEKEHIKSPKDIALFEKTTIEDRAGKLFGYRKSVV
jgi:hypothetical protein